MRVGDNISASEIKNELQFKALLAIAEQKRIKVNHFKYASLDGAGYLYIGILDDHLALSVTPPNHRPSWWHNATSLNDWVFGSGPQTRALKYSVVYDLFFYEDLVSRKILQWVDDDQPQGYRAHANDVYVVNRPYQPKIGDNCMMRTINSHECCHGTVRQLDNFVVLESDLGLLAKHPKDVIFFPAE